MLRDSAELQNVIFLWATNLLSGHFSLLLYVEKLEEKKLLAFLSWLRYGVFFGCVDGNVDMLDHFLHDYSG